MTEPSTTESVRNFIAFWIFGLCNNFAYVIMLSAAEDIMSQMESGGHEPNGNGTSANQTDTNVCSEVLVDRTCTTSALGAVLLADIIPSLIVKMILPFFMHRIPHGVRHLLVCLLQASSYLIVAFSTSVPMSLVGVVFAALGSGIGENAYLALTAHYSRNAISAWSSGTGGAGVFGSLAYAVLTEPHFLGLSPRTTLLVMLVMPVLFYITNYTVLVPSPTLYRAKVTNPKSWLIPVAVKESYVEEFSHAWAEYDGCTDSSTEKEKTTRSTSTISQTGPGTTLTGKERLLLILPLLKYMIPLSLVYYAEYVINQGLTEFLVFDCSHGFRLSKHSQYRWYQVLYQTGVFVSRSSVNLIELPFIGLLLLPVFQWMNTIFFFFDAMHGFVPHIWIVFAIILFEGFFGGASYVNTFHKIHKEVDPRVREYSLAVASLADSAGIVVAGFTTIPVHNYVCSVYK